MIDIPRGNRISWKSDNRRLFEKNHACFCLWRRGIVYRRRGGGRETPLSINCRWRSCPIGSVGRDFLITITKSQWPIKLSPSICYVTFSTRVPLHPQWNPLNVIWMAPLKPVDNLMSILQKHVVMLPGVQIWNAEFFLKEHVKFGRILKSALFKVCSITGYTFFPFFGQFVNTTSVQIFPFCCEPFVEPFFSHLRTKQSATQQVREFIDANKW